MGKEKKEKRVLLEIDSVRIKENDRFNLEVQKYEPAYNTKTKNTEFDWRFRGYVSTVVGGLRLIKRQSLLEESEDLSSLDKILKAVEKSEKKIMQALEEVR